MRDLEGGRCVATRVRHDVLRRDGFVLLCPIETRGDDRNFDHFLERFIDDGTEDDVGFGVRLAVDEF